MEDIRDIKGLVPIPNWMWLWIVAAVVLVVGIVAILLWKRKKTVAQVPVVPPLTPVQLALAALERLRTETVPVEVFYTRLSDIVRQYIEGQFGLKAPERTTEEFLAEAALPAQQMTLLGAFLQESDLVKFAKFQPGEADRQRAFGATEKFVRESAGVEAAVPAAAVVVSASGTDATTT